MPSEPSFGLLKYRDTDNIGDEIQSVAVRRFLPRVDYYLDREELHAVCPPDRKPIWTVLNGWYCSKPENWPPSEYIAPLILSIHISSGITPSGLVPAQTLLAEPAVRYLRGLEPIGARDLYTASLLRRAGVDSYFSGCVTLTLDRPLVDRDDDLVVLCDVPSQVKDWVSGTTRKRIKSVSHGRIGRTSEERFAYAESLLALYARASCVITTRLHCALPCVAMGTPVLFLATAADVERFSGLNELVLYASVQELLSGAIAFDPDHPPATMSKHISLREGLENRLSLFVENATNGRQPSDCRLSAADRLQALTIATAAVTANVLRRQIILEERGTGNRFCADDLPPTPEEGVRRQPQQDTAHAADEMR